MMGLSDLTSVLNDIQKGAAIYDRDGNSIGNVTQVILPDLRPFLSLDSFPYQLDGSIEQNDLARRLRKSGFVTIHIGKSARDRIITPDQISYFNNGVLQLRVKRDDLIRLEPK